MPKIKPRCPGLDTAYLKDFNTNIIPCPKCGHEIEFFSGERKVKCPSCHSSVFRIDSDLVEYKDEKLIFKTASRSCLDWCGGCLDQKDYREIEENNKRIERKKADLKKLVASVDKKDASVIKFFLEAFKKSINHPKLIDEKIFGKIQKKDPGLFIKARNYYLNFIND